MPRVVMELGEFENKSLDGKVRDQVRQISIAASSTGELEQAVDAALRKGWAPVEMIRGTDVETGWPCIWMSKLVGESATA